MTSGTVDQASTLEGSGGQLTERNLWILVGFWLIAFVPIWVAFFAQLWPQDHLSHFPITILLFGYLVYQGVQLQPAMRPKARGYGIFLVGLSAILWFVANYLRSGLLGVVGSLVGFWAIVDLAGGRVTRAAFRPAILLSVAFLTLPFGLDRTLIIGLQKLASRIASAWLDLQNIANIATGVVVRTPEKDFLVEEACSGVNSLFAAVTVALFWAIHSRYNIGRALLFLGSVVFWVLLVNAFRVWVIVFAQLRFKIDLTSEPNHTILGLVTFAAVMLLAASTDLMLRFFVPPRFPDYTLPTPESSTPSDLRMDQGRPLGIAVGLSLAICLISLVSFYRPTVARAAAGTIADASLMPDIPSNVLPEKIGTWELKDSRKIERDPSNLFGLVSQTWRYHNGSFPIIVSLDGPYESWHDLGYCYGGIGWQLRDSQNLDLATEAGQSPLTCVEINLYRGAGDRSLLMFTSIDANGAIVRPPAVYGSIIRNIASRLGVTSAATTIDGVPVKPPVFQVQLFAETNVEMTPEERASIDQLYDYVRRILIGQMTGGNAAEGSGQS
ncbi:MAG TPA: hypothetical protein DDZ51_21135 [Planctomycetaceae bacterium]|nr:hypothetical protein [Planctomycetaceae bacterium]